MAFANKICLHGFDLRFGCSGITLLGITLYGFGYKRLLQYFLPDRRQCSLQHLYVVTERVFHILSPERNVIAREWASKRILGYDLLEKLKVMNSFIYIYI